MRVRFALDSMVNARIPLLAGRKNHMRWHHIAISGGLMAIVLVFAGCLTHLQLSPRERFAYRISEYLDMRQQAVEALNATKATRDRDFVADDTDELASLIQQSRRGLRQGVIFSPPVAAEFMQALVHLSTASDGQEGPQLTFEAHARDVAPHVNGRYLDDQPQTSIPQSVLETLPPLPPPLVYRFVARDLLLVDRDASIIIDILPSEFTGRP
jgi:hypothetical protein